MEWKKSKLILSFLASTGLNWGTYIILLRQKKSPYIPEVKSVWDTDNFDPYEEEEPWIPIEEMKGKKYKKKIT